MELSLFEGRSVEAKKALINALFDNSDVPGTARNDLEITLFETPWHNWGIRGEVGDELGLNYNVEI